MATTTGIFDNFQQSNDLFNTWVQHKQEEEQKRLQPAADLLLDKIVWPSIMAKKDHLFATLKSKCNTAKFTQELQVPIWSFSDVHGYPGYRKNPERSRKIDENGWRQWICLRNSDGHDILTESTLYSVIKKTDFFYQLAKRFGRDFTVSLSTTDAVEEADSTGETYYRHTAQLMLNYFPYGLPPHHMEEQKKWEETFSARLRRSLNPGEVLVLKASSRDAADLCVYGPPHDPWIYKTKASKVGASCYCGSAHDDDEDSYAGY